MGLFDFLFGRAGEAAAAPQAKAADGLIQWEGGSVKYDPGLIPKLIEEHRGLVALFLNIKRSHESGDFAAVKRALTAFKLALNSHLLAENVRFYAYVKNSLSQDAQGLETMTAFWKEMQHIAKAVIQFLGKYEGASFTPDVQAQFGEELDGIGAALTKRIKHEEENLYVLYRPSQAH